MSLPVAAAQLITAIQHLQIDGNVNDLDITEEMTHDPRYKDILDSAKALDKITFMSAMGTIRRCLISHSTVPECERAMKKLGQFTRPFANYLLDNVVDNQNSLDVVYLGCILHAANGLAEINIANARLNFEKAVKDSRTVGNLGSLFQKVNTALIDHGVVIDPFAVIPT